MTTEGTEESRVFPLCPRWLSVRRLATAPGSVIGRRRVLHADATDAPAVEQLDREAQLLEVDLVAYGGER